MLSKMEIRGLIESGNLVSGYIDLETQLQTNGFDLTISELGRIIGNGVVDFDNTLRRIPEGINLPTEGRVPGWWIEPGGAYIARLSETVNLPHDIAALTFARSSLMRCGAVVSNAVWDKGYFGRGAVGISSNQRVFLTKGARIIQMCFFRAENDGSRYDGVFQGEGMVEG